MEAATTREWLEWFYENADFGPAHGDVIIMLQEQFESETGLKVPTTYSCLEES